MAGRKGDVSRSLQFRLSLWLSLTIVLVAAPAGFLSYSYAFDEAIELQDDQLRQTAAWLQRQRFSAPPTEVAGPPDADPESRLDRPDRCSRKGAWKPEDAAPGLRRRRFRTGFRRSRLSGVPWRFFVSTHDARRSRRRRPADGGSRRDREQERVAHGGASSEPDRSPAAGDRRHHPQDAADR